MTVTARLPIESLAEIFSSSAIPWTMPASRSSWSAPEPRPLVGRPSMSTCRTPPCCSRDAFMGALDHFGSKFTSMDKVKVHVAARRATAGGGVGTNERENDELESAGPAREMLFVVDIEQSHDREQRLGPRRDSA